jgi:hypothetical protein
MLLMQLMQGSSPLTPPPPPPPLPPPPAAAPATAPAGLQLHQQLNVVDLLFLCHQMGQCLVVMRACQHPCLSFCLPPSLLQLLLLIVGGCQWMLLHAAKLLLGLLL